MQEYLRRQALPHNVLDILFRYLRRRSCEVISSSTSIMTFLGFHRVSDRELNQVRPCVDQLVRENLIERYDRAIFELVAWSCSRGKSTYLITREERYLRDRQSLSFKIRQETGCDPMILSPEEFRDDFLTMFCR